MCPVKLLPAILAVSMSQACVAAVACDLIDPQSASQLLGAPVSNHTPNRQVQNVNGAAVSDCLYWGPARQLLRVTLVEYKSAADARKEFEAGSSAQAAGGDYSQSVEAGLGDKARWFRFASESRAGMSFTSGRHGIVIDVRSTEATIAANLKDRVKKVAIGALARL